MELRPADLGDAYQTALVLRRAHVRNGAPPTDKATLWSRRWFSRMRLSADVERETTPAMVRYSRPIQVSLGTLGALIAAGSWASPETLAAHLATTAVGAGLVYLSLDTLPGLRVRALHSKAISESEIRRLQLAASGKVTLENLSQAKPLEMPFPFVLPSLFQQLMGGGTNRRSESAATLESDYFNLVLAAMKTPTPESSVALELRATLRQIGMAVANVRRSEVAEDSADAADLIGDAEILAARARSEGDRIVAASLLRQAQAKVAQAKIIERNTLLRRRTRALSAELRAQIAAAQSSLRNLSSQGMMNAESGGAFRVIAESVRTLAVEADSVAQAHEELAVALGQAAPASSPVSSTTATSVAARTPTYISAPNGEVKVVSNRRG